MSNLVKRCDPLLSVLTMVKFETAPSLSLSPAALLVPALMFAATFLERGLALPGLGPSCVDARVQNRMLEQITEFPVPQFLKDCMQNRTPEQITVFPVSQIVESACRIVRLSRLWNWCRVPVALTAAGAPSRTTNRSSWILLPVPRDR